MKIKSKMKSILMTLTLSILSMNAMALEGNGVTLLSENIEASPGLQGGFIQATSQANGKSLYASTLAQTHDEQASIRQNVRLWGMHSFYIANYTNKTQVYTYKYELNCDGKYIRKTDRLSIINGGHANDTSDSFLFVTHDTPGSWSINVTTEVSGESSSQYAGKGNLKVSA